MPDNEMTGSDRKHFSQYVTKLSDATLEQMANQLMDENPDSEELELITDEIELRQIRARERHYTLEQVADKITRLLHPEFSREQHDAQVKRTLAVLEDHVEKLLEGNEEE